MVEDRAWEELARAIPGAVAIQRDGRFVYASEEFATVVGAETAALVGERWQTLFDTRQARVLERTAVDAVGSAGSWQGTVRVGADESAVVELTLTAAGETLLWRVEERDVGAGLGGLAGSESTDADAESAASMRALPAFVRTLLDAVDDVLYVIAEDGEFVLWNEALAETTGYSHAEIGEMAPMAFVPEDQHEYVPGLMDAIASIEDRRVEVDILTRDGERITHEFMGTTFEDPRTGEVYRCGLARDVTERKERERELERYETIVETIDDGVYELDADLRFSFVNDAFCELVERSRADLLGSDSLALFPDDEVTSPAEIRREMVDGDGNSGTLEATLPTSGGERHVESRFRLHPEPDGEFRGSIGVLRDMTERERRERALERQRDELATLDRINELLLETMQELVQTASREAVERRVCERLASSDLYEFAWVGERAFDGDEVVVRASAGGHREYLDVATITADESATGQGPAGRAMRTGEVQVAAVDDPAFDPWREAARERGFASAAAVPLRYRESVFGVLAVYAPRDDAFSQREQDGFALLGRTVGFVIHALRSRDLLFADAVVELEFRVPEGDSLFVRTAAALDCALELEGYVAAGDRWVLYASVDGVAPSEVVDTVSAADHVDSARVITTGDETGRVELVMSESALLHTVTAARATVRAARADPGGARLVVEAPADVDVRGVVDSVRDAYPAAEFVARREHDREVATVGRPGGILDDLTDRQREAIEAAYRAGYFAWPRESTAEDVAASLDLSPATLHGHLRKAEETILGALLDRE